MTVNVAIVREMPGDQSARERGGKSSSIRGSSAGQSRVKAEKTFVSGADSLEEIRGIGGCSVNPLHGQFDVKDSMRRIASGGRVSILQSEYV